MLYESAWNELKSYVPELSALNAMKLVNRAWREIRDARRWTFLKRETVIQTPVAVSTGSVTLTQGSTIVLGNAAANVAWAALGASLLTYQFRLGLGPIYNIASYANPNLTLEFAYGETSTAGGGYNLIKMYYDAPSTDFLRWESIVDPVSAYAFILDWTKEELDRADPQRAAVNSPHRMVSYKQNLVSGLYRYEMWPSPTVIRNYMCLYQVQGIDLVDGVSQPFVIPDELLMGRARYYAYEWAMANRGRYPELQKTDWGFLMKTVEGRYKEMLLLALKNDEEIYIQNFATNYLYPAYSGLTFSSNYWQSHAPMPYY